MSKRCLKAIFIVGNSRSGTSMIARILNNHPDIYTFIHELHFFEELTDSNELFQEISFKKAKKIYANLLSIIYKGYLSKREPQLYFSEAEKCLKQLDQLTPANIYRHFLFYITQKNGKQIPCEQTPRNLFYLKEIFKIFPQAKIINMMRDPRDVLLSQKNKWRLRFIGYKNHPLSESVRAFINYNPFIISKLWNSAIKEYEQFKNDSRVINIKFEDLVLRPEKTLKEVCKFLDINMEKSMFDIPVIGSSFQSSVNKRGIIKNTVTRWKKGGLTPSEIYICQKINADLMKKYGYEIVETSQAPLGLLFTIFSLLLRTPFIVLLNLRRYKNFKEAVLRRFK